MLSRKLTKRENNILMLCASLIIAYISYVLAFKPLYEGLVDLQDRIDASELMLKKNLSIIKREPIIDEQYQKYEKYLKQKSSDEEEMASILSEIGQVANEVNIRVADLKPRKVKKVDFYNRFSVSLTVDGDLLTSTHFLYILQNRPHLFDIEEVRFEKSSSRSSTIKCHLVLIKAVIP